jgi:RING finger protein 113A
MTDAPAPIFKKRTNKSANVRKRPATPPPADSSDSAPDYTDDEQGARVKRRKKEGVTVAGPSTTTTRAAAAAAAHDHLSKSTAFQADRSTTFAANDDATKASNWYTDAALAAKEAGSTTTTTTVSQDDAAGTPTDGTYHGTAKYSTFIQKNPDGKRVGPVKAPTNIRTITVTDFAPDVCKDYKQTGFCGFGDSCKFLHAREDYKQGWQLDKEWESVGKNRKKTQKDGGKEGDADDDDLDAEEKMLRDIPFACVICKDSYRSPVVTKCGHYFCESCAMRRYMKEKKKQCAACGADTQGSFGVARKLKGLLEKKRRREEERMVKEAGEDAGG